MCTVKKKIILACRQAPGMRYEGVWYARKRDMAEWVLEREGKAAT